MYTYTDLHRKRTVTTNLPRCLRPHALPLLAAALLPAPLTAQLGLGLTPMRMEFPAVAGRPYSGSLTLSNSSSKMVRVRTELLEFYVDSNQTPQFVTSAPAESDHSCRQWLTVNPMETEIEPRRQLSVRYTVRVPADAAERSYHCAIGFVSLPSSEDLQGLNVRTAVRVVTTLYPIVGQPDVRGGISELALEAAPAGDKIGWRGVVVMENAGLMLYRPKGSLEVVDAGGKLVEKLEMVSFPVLPHRKQRYILPLKKDLPAGRYTLRARVDVGAEVQEATADVTAEPPGQ